MSESFTGNRDLPLETRKPLYVRSPEGELLGKYTVEVTGFRQIRPGFSQAVECKISIKPEGSDEVRVAYLSDPTRDKARKIAAKVLTKTSAALASKENALSTVTIQFPSLTEVINLVKRREHYYEYRRSQTMQPLWFAVQDPETFELSGFFTYLGTTTAGHQVSVFNQAGDKRTGISVSANVIDQFETMVREAIDQLAQS